jgi:hypothetical protein
MDFVIDYSAYDLAEDLYVRSKIYDITTGTAVFDSNLDLNHVVNGSYANVFAADPSKTYFINTMVYSDNTFASVNTEYTPGSTKISRTLLDSVDLNFKKNTAFDNFQFPMFSTDDGLPKSGATVSALVSIDGASFVASENDPVETGQGVYALDLTADELNGKIITLRFNASDCFPQFATIYTQE